MRFHAHVLLAGAALLLAHCAPSAPLMNQAELTDFAARYAAAWSSQKPASLAAFYEEDGSLRVNAGAPSVGRAAITAKAQAFMTAFPDMVVKLDEISGRSEEHTSEPSHDGIRDVVVTGFRRVLFRSAVRRRHPHSTGVGRAMCPAAG